MRPLHVGVQLPEVEWEVPFPELIAMAKTAESVGFDSLWLGDHLLYDLPEGPRGPWEVWTSLAALATATSTIQLGPLVASTSFHAPAMLAKQAATVDAISGGRLILGLGAGWNKREYTAFGFPYDHRVSRFEEAFTIIRTLLHSGRIDFDGTYYTVEDCVLHPRAPNASTLPLMVGSHMPRMLSICAPHATYWNVWPTIFGNTPAGFAAIAEQVNEKLHNVGLSDSSIAGTCAVFVQLPSGKGRNSVEGHTAEPLRGTPRELAEQLRAFAAAGAAQVQLVLDPITRDSIESLAPMLAALDG